MFTHKSLDLPLLFKSRLSIIGLVLWFFSNNLTLAQTIITAAGGNGIGAAANQLRGPHSVFVDDMGNLYVADATNDRIQKFPPNSTSATNGVTIAGGNGRGSAANQLYYPYGIFVDEGGNIYVADSNNHRIQKFPPNSTSGINGTTVAGGNGGGSAANQLSDPTDIFVDETGYMYVSDSDNNRIQKFPPNSTSAINGITVAGRNGGGSTADRLDNPLSVFVDRTGSIFVVDNFNARIQKFPLNSTSGTNGITVAGGNGRGSATNQLDSPVNAFVDESGRIYIADFYNARIQKYTLSPIPDLSLLLYARPTKLYGTTPVTVVVDVLELNGVTSSGLITLKISQDAKLSLTLPSDSTVINNRSVNNSVWSLSGPTNGYYTLTTNQPVAAGDKLSVGLTGSFNPSGSSGLLTVSGVLVGNSGGEQRITNNTDADKFDYFQQ